MQKEKNSLCTVGEMASQQMALGHGGGSSLLMRKRGSECSPCRASFEDCVGLGKRSVKGLLCGEEGVMQQAGQRDSLKGSWVYWDLMARASALVPYRRCVLRGARERGPEEWCPRGAARMCGLVSSLDAALPLWQSGPSKPVGTFSFAPASCCSKTMGKLLSSCSADLVFR